MPALDMSLDKLKQYQGISPRPEDFDAYWERSLQEMYAVDPQVELVKAEHQFPSAECYHLYFSGVRGARLHAKYLKPKQVEGPHPAVILFHGYSGSSGEWWDKLSYVSLGYSVIALDVRGQGGRSEDVGGVVGNTLRGHIIRGLDSGPDDLLFRHIFLDTAQLAGIVMGLPEVDAARVGVFGGSQGGALALVCAALEPRISRAVSMYPFLSDYRRVWEMDLAKDAYEELRTYFRLFDPLHQREDEIFHTLGYIDIQHLVARIRGRVLMGLSLMDSICPPSTQFAAYNKITSEKECAIYPDFGHEILPGFNDRKMLFLSQL